MAKVCIIGAGAIGSELAVRLAAGGTEVSVLARGAVLAAIRARGIAVRRRDGEVLRCLPKAASDASYDLGPQDAVIIAVKAPALPSVATQIAPLLVPGTVVAFVMNGLPWWYGVSNAGPLARWAPAELDREGAPFRDVPPARVVGGVIYSACTMVEPGVVHSEHDDAKLVLGHPDGDLAAATRDLAGWFQAGGLRCEVTPDIRAEVWGKR